MSKKELTNKLLLILIVFMPLHTMLVDKFFGSTIFSLGGLLNIWRDVIILLLFLYTLYTQRGMLRNNRFNNIIFAAIATLMICMIVSPAPFGHKANILRIYVIPMLMVPIMLSVKMEKDFYEKIIRLLFVQGIGLSLFGYFQTFILGEEFLINLGYGTDGYLHYSFYIGGWYGFQRLVSTFASPNNCALYLLQIFIISFVNKDVLESKWKWTKVGLGIIGLGIVATFSRSSWLALGTCLVIYTFFIAKRKIKKYDMLFLLAMPIALVLLVVVDFKVLNSRMINMISSSISGVVNKTDASFLMHFQDVIFPIKDMIKHPFGLGFAMSGPIALAIIGEGVELVESAVWLTGYDAGIIGLLLYFLPYALVIAYYCFKRRALEKNTAGYVALATMMVFLLLPLHQNIESTFLVYLFIGLSQNVYLKKNHEKMEAY